MIEAHFADCADPRVAQEAGQLIDVDVCHSNGMLRVDPHSDSPWARSPTFFLRDLDVLEPAGVAVIKNPSAHFDYHLEGGLLQASLQPVRPDENVNLQSPGACLLVLEQVPSGTVVQPLVGKLVPPEISLGYPPVGQ